MTLITYCVTFTLFHIHYCKSMTLETISGIEKCMKNPEFGLGVFHKLSVCYFRAAMTASAAVFGTMA
jgi:hypothetical protein